MVVIYSERLPESGNGLFHSSHDIKDEVTLVPGEAPRMLHFSRVVWGSGCRGLPNMWKRREKVTPKET